MCTAIAFDMGERYFGRNLDIDRSFGERVCVLPRRYPIEFRHMESVDEHYAIIGMASVIDSVPLLYDGFNEKGICAAGLNFPDNAHYFPVCEGKDNIASFELISWVLARCGDMDEVRELLGKINISDTVFAENMPCAPLHWIISDGSCSVVVEQMADGLHIHDNKIGVLTNNPPFEYQMFALNNYRNLRANNEKSDFSEKLELSAYCEGLGALGLPGDVSSMSRFVRAAFGKASSVCEKDELSCVTQMFHILSSVEMLRGICRTSGYTWDMTLYSACMSLGEGKYYYSTYNDRSIHCVDMYRIELDKSELSEYPLADTARVIFD